MIHTYYSSTNRQNTNKQWMRQTLNNRNRREYFYLNGIEKKLDDNFAFYSIDEINFGFAQVEDKQNFLDHLDQNNLDFDINNLDFDQNFKKNEKVFFSFYSIKFSIFC